MPTDGTGGGDLQGLLAFFRGGVVASLIAIGGAVSVFYGFAKNWHTDRKEARESREQRLDGVQAAIVASLTAERDYAIKERDRAIRDRDGERHSGGRWYGRARFYYGLACDLREEVTRSRSLGQLWVDSGKTGTIPWATPNPPIGPFDESDSA